MTKSSKMNQSLLQLYQSAIAAAEGRASVRKQLPQQGLSAPVTMVAIGKAAASMAQGAVDVLGDQIEIGLVITKHGHADSTLPFETIEAGHPTPDAESLRAGKRLLALIENSPEGQPLLFLISGGASALVEVLPEGMGLEQLQRATDWLLGSGLDIHEMNRVRKGLSLIKAGRLAERLVGHPVTSLMISDVPGDAMSAIGSGLLVTDECSGAAIEGLPDWLEKHLLQGSAVPAADAPCFTQIYSEIVASNHIALDAAEQQAIAMGLTVHRHTAPISGSAEAMAKTVVDALEKAPGLHIWGGESTVILPRHPGRGGRNQHLALHAASLIKGRDDMWVLAAGSDGSDGPTEDTGALVDGDTVIRGGLHYEGSIEQALHGFDAGSYLEASGDLIQTGPTGTNVMDIILAYRQM
ncbi:MAG: DUF4147 domain-containing protein [Gammaproteobacteria bacterium]|nr:DUF4147 domain-containing protein [Gammaproteobacteria bacterium]